LAQWAGYIADAARQGALTGRQCPVTRIETVAGPRAGALEIYAGLNSGHLMRALAKDDCAVLRQFVPWGFTGEPQCYMHGRYVRVEAGWSKALAESLIRLGDLSPKPAGAGQWVAGKSETGATIVPALSDRTPHFLVSGATGSGKSVSLRSAVLQLSADAANELVLVDGKFGESLRAVERLAGVVGPCAVEGPQVRSALGWAAAEMRRRYEQGRWRSRVIVVFDEFQEFVGDQSVVDLLRKLTAQGRGAHVHCLLATQHPTVDAFKDPAIRRCLTGKIALMVNDPDASRVAVGGATPRADRLLGAGDAYTVGPGSCHRVQMAYVDEREIERANRGTWQYGQWPEFEPEEVGQELPQTGWHYGGGELAVSLVSASESEGRPRMVRRLEEAGLGRPGAERAIRLLKLGRDTHEWLRSHDYAVCLSGSALTGAEGA
jgi:hypothetical protein